MHELVYSIRAFVAIKTFTVKPIQSSTLYPPHSNKLNPIHLILITI